MTNPADTVIKGGVLASGNSLRRADVFISDGRVDGIESAESQRAASRIIDATGKFVLPGIIDAHLHPFYADHIDTLSISAVYGGITTLIPYVGAMKAWGKSGNLFEAVKSFINEGEANSVVDFGAHCSLSHDDMDTLTDTIPRIAELGVLSFKAFMAYSKRGMKLEDIELLKAMEVIKENGGLFAVHAENGTILDYLEEAFTAQGLVGPEYYYPSHPNIAEADAVFRILSLAEVIECPIYLPHISAAESLQVIDLFRKWGKLKFFVETCVHYLTLTDEEMNKRGALAKVGPPLRSVEDVSEMWKAVNEGVIDVIASDTAGYLSKSKEPLWGDVFKAPSGLPGLETMFTVAYDEGVNKGKTTLPRLVKLFCENPAKVFGLYPKKGTLQEGSDADVVIFDPTKPFTIRADDLHGKVDYTMYGGRTCVGVPVTVMQRGNILLENGEMKAEPGQGKYLPRNGFITH